MRLLIWFLQVGGVLLALAGIIWTRNQPENGFSDIPIYVGLVLVFIAGMLVNEYGLFDDDSR